MSRTPSDSTTISFRVPREESRLIRAVAYADLVARTGTSTRPSEVNLSEFVRTVIEDVASAYIEQAGGANALLEELHAAEVRALEEELEGHRRLQQASQRLAAIDQKTAAARPSSRSPRRGRESTNR